MENYNLNSDSASENAQEREDAVSSGKTQSQSNRFKTKRDFLAALEKELKNFNVSDRTEIMSDFNRHFEDSLAQGLNEEQICERLGDVNEITEIAQQYADGESYQYYSPETETEPEAEDIYTANEYKKIFTSGYFEIDVSTIIAKTVIGLSGDNNTYIEYKSTRPGTVFTADIVGTKLEIKERIEGLGSWLLSFAGKSSLQVLVPRKVYDKVSIHGVSANAQIDRIESIQMNIRSVSCNINASVWAENLDLNTVSGKIICTNIGNNPVKLFKLRSVSANADISGFTPEKYDISVTSGTITATGLGGDGKLNLVSGRINLDYALWNGDLDIMVVSGTIKLNVPQDSGANLNFSRIGGSVKYTLAQDKGYCRKNGDYSFGGSNRKNISAFCTSGIVSILSASQED